MAAKLRERSDGAKRVLAVVGAGHLKACPTIWPTTSAHRKRSSTRLCRSNKTQYPVDHLTLMTLIIGGIAWGYYHGGRDLGHVICCWWRGPLRADRHRRAVGRCQPVELAGRCRCRAVQAVPPRPAFGHVQCIGRSAPAQTRLSSSWRCAMTPDLARVVSQQGDARGAGVHADQLGHDCRRMDGGRAHILGKLLH